MAKGRLRFLSREEIERIHEHSIRVLGEIGILVMSEPVSKMLEENGCVRSEDGRRLLIPEEIVQSSLASAPKTLLLAALNREHDMRIPTDGTMFMANGGQGVFIKDLLTNERRVPTTADLRDFAILAERMPQIDYCWNMVGALKEPNELKGLVELKTALMYSSKHLQGEAMTGTEARQMVEMVSKLVGGEESLRRRPILSSVQCPISPLSFDLGLVEAQVEFARSGIPVVAMAASIAGLTSPITISGTLVQVNAENLASLVISQTAAKGSPWIYSSDASPPDMQTGSIDYGAFEAPLISVGAGEMGKYYGLPTMVGGVSLEDEISVSLDNLAEGVGYMRLSSLIPSDLGSGFGGVEQAAGASFEQFVIDAWIWELAREFSRTFDSDDEAISFETIREAALDGTYLNKRQTIERYRKEYQINERSEIDHVPSTKVKPGKLVKEARSEIQRLLKGPKDPILPKDDIEAMNAVIENARTG